MLNIIHQYEFLIVIGIIVVYLAITLVRGGTARLSFFGLEWTLGVPAADVWLTVHRPILMRAIRDLATLLRTGTLSNISDVYKDLLMGASRCARGKHETSVALMVERNGELVCKEVYRHSQGAKMNWTFNLGERSPAVDAFKNQTIYNCPDVKRDTLWKPLPNSIADRYSSFICIPITLEGTALGLLLVDSPRKAAFTTREEEDLKRYAETLAFVLSLEYSSEGGGIA